jgi:hypothetical protein
MTTLIIYTPTIAEKGNYTLFYHRSQEEGICHLYIPSTLNISSVENIEGFAIRFFYHLPAVAEKAKIGEQESLMKFTVTLSSCKKEDLGIEEGLNITTPLAISSKNKKPSSSTQETLVFKLSKKFLCCSIALQHNVYPTYKRLQNHDVISMSQSIVSL